MNSIINERKKKRKRAKSLIFENSIENYLWSLNRVPPARKAGEEASKRVILPRIRIWKNAHTKWRPPLSRVIALRSPSRACFSHVGKPAILFTRRFTVWPVLCSPDFSTTVREFPRLCELIFVAVLFSARCTSEPVNAIIARNGISGVGAAKTRAFHFEILRVCNADRLQWREILEKNVYNFISSISVEQKLTNYPYNHNISISIVRKLRSRRSRCNELPDSSTFSRHRVGHL